MQNTIVLLLSLFMWSCASAAKLSYLDMKLPISINEDPTRLLTSEQVDQELRLLKYALSNAYSGAKYLPDQQFAHLLGELDHIDGPMTAKTLCEKIDTALNRVSDAHIKAKLGDDRCLPEQKPIVGHVGQNFYHDKEIPWTARLEKRNGKRVLLISITGFRAATNPVWNGFIEKVKSLMPKADFAILDMRGNGGGDDTKGNELAVLMAGASLESPYADPKSIDTPEAWQLFVNASELWIQQAKKEKGEAGQYLLDMHKDFLAKRDRAATGGSTVIIAPPRTTFQAFDRAKSFAKPIYILIDAACASSCESSTHYFEYNPLVKTVGENTAGYVHFGNNGNLVLPHSGIKLQMATTYNSFKDGRFIEKTGIVPHILVKPGDDAMQAAWKDFLKD